jgi:hypothetical protein
MSRFGLPRGPYPSFQIPRPLPKKRYKKKSTHIRIENVPVPHNEVKLAHVSSISNLATDYVYVNADGTKASGTNDGIPIVDFRSQNGFGGVTNPYWKQQIRNGQSATTNCNGQMVDYEQAFFSAEINVKLKSTGQHQNVNFYGHVPLDAPPGNLPSPSDMTYASNRAISKFLSDVDAVTSAFEAGQDFGEWNQTLEGVRRPMKSLRDLTLGYLDKVTYLARSYKELSENRIKLRKALTDTYLEWTFGWKPLALDVAAGIVGIQNRSRHYDVTPVKKGFKLDYFGDSAYIPNYYTGSQSAMTINKRRKTRCSYIVSYKGAVRTGYGGKPVPIDTIVQADLPHFLPTAWDLLPYSFVLDYFVNVGDVIRAYSLNQSQISWCKQTILTIGRHDLTYESGGPLVPSSMTVESFKSDSVRSFVEKRSFTRTVVSPGSLRPVLAFHLPTGEKPWLNMAALMSQRITRIVPLWFMK